MLAVRPLLALALLVAAVRPLHAPRAAAAGCANADARPAKTSRSALSRAVRCLVNAERRARGLPALGADGRLARAARRHGSDMVARRYFSHVTPEGADVHDRLRKAGYLKSGRSWAVGENLAWLGGSRATPRRIVRAWMGSPSHRRNILTGGFRGVGIGVVRNHPGGRGGATYVAEFGSRKP